MYQHYPALNKPEYEQHCSFLREFCSKVQLQTLQYLRTAMLEVVKLSGGLETCESATSRQRRAVLVTMFKQHPLRITELFLHRERTGVHFEAIWGTDEEVNMKWQRMIMNIFVALADAVYTYHTREILKGKKNPNQGPLFQLYKEVRWTDSIRGLKLGDVGDVPSRPSPTSDGLIIGIPEGKAPNILPWT